MVGENQKCYLPATMAKLRLTLLGGFEARTDSGLSLAIPRRKAQMLLAYLAMHPKQTHLRDKLGLFSILFAMVSKAEVAEDNSNSLVFRSKGDGPVARWEPQCGIRRPNLYA